MTSQSARHRNPSGSASLALLGEVSRRLKNWLVKDAYPRWWQQGADRVHGGFHERLQQNGQPSNEPRRARLHPRQIYSFSVADDLGHHGLTEPAMRHALDYFLRHYVRSDQFIRASVAPDGRVVDDSVLLYDQAFALLGYASAFYVFNDESLRNRARQLLVNLRAHFANPAGGFREAPDRKLPLTSNSHMHLLEAALAWMVLDRDRRWRSLAEELVQLARRRLMDPVTTQIREFFTPEWKLAPGAKGRVVEPGHQFEWAWLLLRWQVLAHDAAAGDTAVALIDFAESRGVDAGRGVVVNSLLEDGSIGDGRARLWPQTERLKAACLGWDRMRLPAYCDFALRAAVALESYLQTTTPGLWRDTMRVGGTWIDEPAPASSLYHIVSAIAELDSLVDRAGIRSCGRLKNIDLL